jgi:hypothetical protein
MMPDLVDQSASKLVETLSHIYYDQEIFLIMDEVLASVASRNSPMYKHMVPFWKVHVDAFVERHGRERVAKFVIDNPYLAAHILAAQI